MASICRPRVRAAAIGVAIAVLVATGTYYLFPPVGGDLRLLCETSRAIVRRVPDRRRWGATMKVEIGCAHVLGFPIRVGRCVRHPEIRDILTPSMHVFNPGFDEYDALLRFARHEGYGAWTCPELRLILDSAE